MVDTKKEQERDELHRAIWAIADELRGAVDVLRVFGIGSLAYLVRLRREIDVDGGGDLLHILLRCIGKGVQLHK